jgi:hypothetical protein
MFDTPRRCGEAESRGGHDMRANRGTRTSCVIGGLGRGRRQDPDAPRVDALNARRRQDERARREWRGDVARQTEGEHENTESEPSVGATHDGVRGYRVTGIVDWRYDRPT